MYIYFDKHGIIKEVINDAKVRMGSANANTIYAYFEGDPLIDDLWIVMKKPNGELTTEKSFVDNKVTTSIPYQKNRSLKYFEDYKNYDFYYYDLTSDETHFSGLAYCTIRAVIDNAIYAEGMITFNIEKNIIKNDNNITQSQYDYLLLSYASRTLNNTVGNDLDNLISNRVDQKLGNTVDSKINAYRNEIDSDIEDYKDGINTSIKTFKDDVNNTLGAVESKVTIDISNVQQTLSGLGQLKPSGTDTSTNILAFTEDKGIYIGTNDGHWYYWNATDEEYNDGGTYQSSVIGDKSINFEKLTGENKRQLFDLYNNSDIRLDLGAFVDGKLSATGTVNTNYTTWSVSDYVDISYIDCEKIIVKNVSDTYQRICFYNATKEFTHTGTLEGDFVVDKLDGDCYFRAECLKANNSLLEIKFKSKLIEKNSENTDKINYFDSKINSIVGMDKLYLLLGDFTDNYKIKTTGDLAPNYSLWTVSDYIDLSPISNKVYITNDTDTYQRYAFYNSSKVLISTASLTDELIIADIPENAKYLRVECLKTNKDILKVYGVYKIVSNVQENTNRIDKMGYVVVDNVLGDDSNEGTKEKPFKTIKRAVDSGVETIYLNTGTLGDRVYTEKIAISNRQNVKIAPLFWDWNWANTPHTDVNSIVIDLSTELTLTSASNGLLECTFATSENDLLYKVFVSKDLPLVKGSSTFTTHYNCVIWEGDSDDWTKDIRLKPVLTLAECQAEEGTFYYDGTKIHVNPTMTGANYHLGSNDEYGIYINGVNHLLMNDIIVKYSNTANIYLYEVRNAEIRNVTAEYCCGGRGFYLRNTNGEFYNCTARKNTSDGFGIHTFGSYSFFNCVACYNTDDGMSPHDGTKGSFNNCLCYNNVKGGFSIVNGAQFDCYNCIAYGQNSGIMATSGENNTRRVMRFMNNVCYDNLVGLNLSRDTFYLYNNKLARNSEYNIANTTATLIKLDEIEDN